MERWMVVPHALARSVEPAQGLASGMATVLGRREGDLEVLVIASSSGVIPLPWNLHSSGCHGCIVSP